MEGSSSSSRQEKTRQNSGLAKKFIISVEIIIMIMIMMMMIVNIIAIYIHIFKDLNINEISPGFWTHIGPGEKFYILKFCNEMYV